MDRPSEVIRILVVDDVPLVRLKLARILRSEGFVCLEAPGVEEALEILEREPIELVFCDLVMPGKSGLDLVRALGSRIPDVSVVMVSSVEDASAAIECIHLGAFGYILKPFEPREILVQLSAALRRRMLEIEHRDHAQLLARQVREQTLEIRESREELAIRLISASEERDFETGAHVRRIGLYAARMALLLGWDQDHVDTIRLAAPMHDIGKIGIPDAILKKPGRLTEEEWVVMRRHTLLGARILRGSRASFLQMGASIAACHHEKWDGSGYPKGLRGESIPIEARIVGLVDVYDALSHRRHYKEPLGEQEVLSLLREGRGGHFDPGLLDLFLEDLDSMRAIREQNPDPDPEEPDDVE